MREISSYSLKIVEVERILSDLDIVSTIALKINATTSIDIVHALENEQGSDFIQQKQSELNLILNKQQKRIQQLRNFIQKLETHLQQTSDQCGIKLTFNLQSNATIDQSTIIPSTSIYSQASYNLKFSN
jgi:hypothetical protein